MNKQQLEQIFSKEYQPDLWREVLTDVFGVTNLYQTPKTITLNLNKVAKEAFELGSFDTSDDRIIGLYQVDLNDNPNIERNRVGLRETLRSIYKYDVDGALVVFVQGDKWRLSFISEIRTLDDEGKIVEQATEPKRYTYLLGIGEKVKTSAIRLAKIAGQDQFLEDIREAFSVEALNEEFYKIVRDYFYQLVGGTVKKGSRNTTYEKLLKLPIADKSENEKHFREFAVRLIGRTTFCWFLKVKESDSGIPLLPESLLSKEAVNKNPNYYHNILERLFFQTLNTPMEKRRDDLPKGCEIIPFLNGGLFEPQLDDYYEPNRGTGINNNLNTLEIPDEWFEEFVEEISHYNFTADENSPVDIEFSIDPEMLGRIFENLLAEIDPDTGESARKATGSFYTPREIVSYMVDESLIYFLKAKLLSETKGFGFQAIDEEQTTMFGNEARIQQKLEIPLDNNRWTTKSSPPSKGGEDAVSADGVVSSDPLESALRDLFSRDTNEHQFNETETEILIKAIDDCKVLDPACGSGAFPIGVLQRLVFLLEKLDPDNKKWKLWQKEKAIEETEKAFDKGDKNQRDVRLLEINEAFEKDSSDYGRKLFLIERCIYGVDIQPIAAEISKLRCFLTLVVEDTVTDDFKNNRGVRHLSNLEFKFVTADALLKLPDSGLFHSDAQLKKLEKIRTEYLKSFGEKKESLKADFKNLQGDILDEQIANYQDSQDERAIKLGGWKPFEHEKTDWFDPLWMFGVKDFDIVIGNPPYIRQEKIKKYKALFSKNYSDVYSSTADILIYFYALGYELLQKKGILTFITSNKFYRAGYGKNLRNFLSQKMKVKQIIDFGDAPVFEATAYASINILRKANPNGNNAQVWTFPQNEKIADFQFGFNRSSFQLAQKELTKNSWRFEEPNVLKLLNKIKLKGVPLGIYIDGNFCYGIKTGCNEAFIVDEQTRNSLIAKHKTSEEILKPLLRGKDVNRWKVESQNLWLIFTKRGIEIENYPAIKKHLLQFETKLRKRAGSQEWFELQASPADSERFEVPKIIYPDIYAHQSFAWDTKGFYSVNTVYFVPTNEKWLTALLNSRLIEFYYGRISNKIRGGYFRAFSDYMKQIPIAKTTNSQKQTFENLADYILFLNELENTEQINDYVPNSGIAEQFEEVIDALVYELYFEEDFRRENIEFLKYAERDFPSIENLGKQEKIETIHAAHQKLRQKDNEIRNNLKLMDIRLADLIMPIKAGR